MTGESADASRFSPLQSLIAAACKRNERMRVMMAENGEQESVSRVPIGRSQKPKGNT